MKLTIDDVSKTYPNGTQALKDVSLTIPPGMFGLLGPNGAVKSTLMRTIATLQEPDAGSVRLGDIDVLAEKQALRKRLGYLPQEIGVFAADADVEADEQRTLYRGKHRVTDGEQTISVTVDEAPARAGIDPYVLLIDRNTDDNVTAVSEAMSASDEESP